MRWVWVGDSILAGMGSTLSDSLRSRGDTGFIHANTGWAVWRWAREGNVPALVRSKQPDVVVLALGTNDEGAAKEQFVRNVKDLTDKAKTTGARVIWIGPFNSRERNDWGEKASGDWIDGMELAEGLPRTADGVHFPQATYADLAARTLAAVDAVLAGPAEVLEGRSWLWSLALGVLAGAGIVAGLRWYRRRR